MIMRSSIAAAVALFATSANAADVDCVVSSWSDATCTVTCGGGFQTQTRTVETPHQFAGAACPALSRQSACGEGACPQDCLVSDWAQWSACSLTCGGGTRSRTRAVAVSKSGGGQDCPTLEDDGTCNDNACPIDGGVCKYTAWNPWDGCTKACTGADSVSGVQMRTRAVMAEGTGAGACDVTTLSETRTCSTRPCVPTDCKLGAFSKWSKCSATCGGGTQRRTKHVDESAKEGGTCELVSMGGDQTRPCSTSPCPVEPSLQVQNGAVLTGEGGDDHDNEVVHADSDYVFSGGKRLYKLNKADLKVLGNYDPAPMTAITAIAGDDQFIYVAGKGATAAEHQVHKVSKATLAKTHSYTVSVSSVASGNVIAMQIDHAKVYLSLAGDNAGAIVALNKANMQPHGDVRELAAQANALALDSAGLYAGTWATPASVYVLNPTDLSVVQQTQLTDNKHSKLVSIALDDESVFFGTDSEPSYIVHLGRDLTTKADKELDAGLGKCVSMVADWGYLYCGTTAATGSVLKVKKADLTLDANLQLTASQSVFYALAHDSNGNIFAPTWSASGAASQVVELSGYMSAKQCTVGPWSALGACVDYWTRLPKKCGAAVKISQREVREQAQWGGAGCPTLIKTEACTAAEKECCHGGSVWSKSHFFHDCSTETVAPTETVEADFDCRCPMERPVTIGTGDKRQCVETAKCHAHTCSQVQCQFLDDGTHHKIKVMHNVDKHSVDLDHHCSYSMARSGGCHCMCWQPACATNTDCRAGTVCGSNMRCAPSASV